MADEEPIYSRIKQGIVQLGSTDSQETRRIRTDDDGRLLVNVETGTIISSESSVVPLATNGVQNVTDGTLTTIVTYTAGADKKISKISVSGTDYAKFQLFLNTVLIETKRSGPERSLDFTFDNPLALASGDVLDVKVTHYAPSVLADFESTVYGY